MTADMAQPAAQVDGCLESSVDVQHPVCQTFPNLYVIIEHVLDCLIMCYLVKDKVGYP